MAGLYLFLFPNVLYEFLLPFQKPERVWDFIGWVAYTTVLLLETAAAGSFRWTTHNLKDWNKGDAFIFNLFVGVFFVLAVMVAAYSLILLIFFWILRN